MNAVNAWLEDTSGEHLVECAECGHLHFDTRTRKYIDCPLKHDGCDCLGQP